MKVALFCNEFPPRQTGGIGTFTSTLVLGLIESGHQVTLIETGMQNVVSIESLGLKRVTLKKSKLLYIGGFLIRVKLWLYLQKSWFKGEIDVVEVPDFEGYIPFPSLIPVVVRLHISTTLIYCRQGRKPPTTLYLFEYWTLKFAKSWIGVSQFILKETENGFKIEKKSKSIVYNPIKESVIVKSQEQIEQIILFAGTLSERKGVLTLAHALALVLERNPLANVIFAGRSTEYQGRPIEDTVKKVLNEYLHQVSFLGHISHNEMLLLMANATCFVFPSKFESFGLVVAEAMSIGLPVIYTKFPPGPELVKEGITGLLVDPENPSEIAKAIERLISDPEFSQQLAHAARTYCLENFTLDNCVKATIANYKQIID